MLHQHYQPVVWSFFLFRSFISSTPLFSLFFFHFFFLFSYLVFPCGCPCSLDFGFTSSLLCFHFGVQAKTQNSSFVPCTPLKSTVCWIVSGVPKSYLLLTGEWTNCSTAMNPHEIWSLQMIEYSDVIPSVHPSSLSVYFFWLLYFFPPSFVLPCFPFPTLITCERYIRGLTAAYRDEGETERRVVRASEAGGTPSSRFDTRVTQFTFS